MMNSHVIDDGDEKRNFEDNPNVSRLSLCLFFVCSIIRSLQRNHHGAAPDVLQPDYMNLQVSDISATGKEDSKCRALRMMQKRITSINTLEYSFSILSSFESSVVDMCLC